MKDFVFVKFSNGSSDCVYKGWMVGDNKCYWPPKNIQSLAKQKAKSKENWKLCNCEILCDSSEFKYTRLCMQYLVISAL